MIKTNQEQSKASQNIPVPFLHPLIEPYREIGVELTATFGLAPHVDRILQGTKQDGETLLTTYLSPQQ